jgi:hypothetical protein
LAKIDKRQFTKEQWKIVKEQRRLAKEADRDAKYLRSIPSSKENQTVEQRQSLHNIAFVLGNGNSRSTINVEELSQYGVVYGCNAIYRKFAPDYLVAVDVKMVLEITKSGYQKKHKLWTNPNKAYSRIPNLNTFNPSKGWSSGPTALWLASQHSYEKIYILGFDYRGLDDGKKFNNIYADTVNYKKSTDGATFFGNWLRQTSAVVKENTNIKYIRVITPDNYKPEELNKFSNFSTITVDDFKKIHQLS